MKNITLHPVVFAVGVLVLFGVGTQALEVKHTNLGDLARETYESQSTTNDIIAGSGALPSISPGPGSWSSDIAGNATGRVLNTSNPGPVEGSNYVRAAKNGLVGSGNRLHVALDFNNDVLPDDEGKITARFSTYIDSQGASLNEQSMIFGLKVNADGTGAEVAFLDFIENGDLIVGGSGAGGSPGGSITFKRAFTPDAWLSVEMVYNVVSNSSNDSFDVNIWRNMGSNLVPEFSVYGITNTGDDGGRPIRSGTFASGNFARWYLDAFVPPSSTVAKSSNIVLEASTGTSFQDKGGYAYRLQSSPDMVSSNFTDTGAIVISDGGVMTLFDPSGVDTTKVYRVVR